MNQWSDSIVEQFCFLRKIIFHVVPQDLITALKTYLWSVRLETVATHDCYTLSRAAEAARICLLVAGEHRLKHTMALMSSPVSVLPKGIPLAV